MLWDTQKYANNSTNNCLSITYKIVKNFLRKSGEGFNDSTLQFVGSTTALSVVFSLIINGLLFYLLYRFSTLAKKAIITDNPGQLGQGLTSLSTYFKVVGILILAVIGLLFVAMLFMSLGAATK